MKQWPEKQSEIHIDTVIKGSTFTKVQTLLGMLHNMVYKLHWHKHT